MRKCKERFVCIEWEDASYNAGYYEETATTHFHLMPCMTVGHLIKAGRKEVILAMDEFEDGDHRRTATLPRASVRKIRYLEDRK